MSQFVTKYIKVNVGQVFQFILVKQLCIVHQNYFLMEDEEENRFIIPMKYYSNYGFKIGDPINCKLDRINCKGEIFFEPLHPIYKSQNAYSFTYVGRKEIKHVLGFTEYVNVVKDQSGLEQVVRYSNTISSFNQNDSFYLWSIRKGRLLLVPMVNNEPIFKLNGIYNFKIEQEYQTDRLGAGLLLLDDFGNNHVIARNHYKNFDLKVGETIQCRIDGSSTKGYFYLEPLHPSYTIGNVYKFEIFNFIKEQGKIHCFVLDCFGDIVKFEISNNKINLLPGDKIKCKVTTVKKGQPELELV